MKKKLYTIWMALPCFAITVQGLGQANTALSNLVSPTSVNQSLLPKSSDTYTLGNASKSWKTLYISAGLYLNGMLSVQSPGTNNFFAGPSAGNTTLSGNNNTSLGYNALHSITTGNCNTAAGVNSLYKNTSGFGNTAYGYYALQSNVSGRTNTAFGYNALYSNTTGYGNTAIGARALYKNTTGSRSVAVGDSALFNQTGNDGNNSAVGNKALYSNTTGFGNTASGYYTLENNVSGNTNSAYGYNALRFNTTGHSNIGVGARALYQNTTGSNNIAIGDSALFNQSGDGLNTAIGSKALYTNTTGISNTAIGYRADVTSSGLSNATAIGANAQVSASNSLVLGASGTKVGIGTSAPAATLHVVGNQTLEGNLTFTAGTQFIQFANPGTAPSPMIYMFTSGTVNADRMIIAHSPSYPNWGLRYSDLRDDFDFLSNGTSVMRIDLSSQYVGIGTTSPAYKLDVCGTIRAKEVRVETGWCDYVFEKDYKLRSIDELEKYISNNKHLPGIAPASEVEKDGLKVAEMNKAMMEKIEELTLYVIQLSKDNKKLQAEIDALKK